MQRHGNTTATRTGKAMMQVCGTRSSLSRFGLSDALFSQRSPFIYKAHLFLHTASHTDPQISHPPTDNRPKTTHVPSTVGHPFPYHKVRNVSIPD